MGTKFETNFGRITNSSWGEMSLGELKELYHKVMGEPVSVAINPKGDDPSTNTCTKHSLITQYMLIIVT